MESCRFCDIIVNKKEVILYEDDYFILINDIRPDAKIHLQAITKRHIININYLSKDELPLMEHVKAKTEEYFAKNHPGEKLM
jgi:diadenosine tetraphosphate (Ap4A) HIT family hydrolase